MTDALSFDATPQDLATLGCALLYVLAVLHRRGLRSPQDLVADLMQGLSVFPYLLMSVVVFSSGAMTLLMTHNRMFLSIAGVVAAIHTLGGFSRRA